jgi:hypothetical protein
VQLAFVTLETVEEAVATPKDSRKHIPLGLLWRYSRDIGSLTPTYMDHIQACEDCMGILGICRTGRSIEEVKRIAEEEGFYINE